MLKWMLTHGDKLTGHKPVIHHVTAASHALQRLSVRQHTLACRVVCTAVGWRCHGQLGL
jgi:hypothetical protein